ncbi:hypothetical protein ABPG75_004329 [Micractinium tetrahymenae]
MKDLGDWRTPSPILHGSFPQHPTALCWLLTPSLPSAADPSHAQDQRRPPAGPAPGAEVRREGQRWEVAWEGGPAPCVATRRPPACSLSAGALLRACPMMHN